MPRIKDRVLWQYKNLRIGGFLEDLFIPSGKIGPAHGSVENEIPAENRAKTGEIKGQTPRTVPWRGQDMAGFVQKRMGARCKRGERKGSRPGESHESPCAEFGFKQMSVRLSGQDLRAGRFLERGIPPDMVEMEMRVQDMGQFESLALYEGEQARGFASRIDDQGLVDIIVYKITIGFQGTELKDFYVQHNASQGLEDENTTAHPRPPSAAAMFTISIYTRYPSGRKGAARR